MKITTVLTILVCTLLSTAIVTNDMLSASHCLHMKKHTGSIDRHLLPAARHLASATSKSRRISLDKYSRPAARSMQRKKAIKHSKSRTPIVNKINELIDVSVEAVKRSIFHYRQPHIVETHKSRPAKANTKRAARRTAAAGTGRTKAPRRKRSKKPRKSRSKQRRPRPRPRPSLFLIILWIFVSVNFTYCVFWGVVYPAVKGNQPRFDRRAKKPQNQDRQTIIEIETSGPNCARMKELLLFALQALDNKSSNANEKVAYAVAECRQIMLEQLKRSTREEPSHAARQDESLEVSNDESPDSTERTSVASTSTTLWRWPLSHRPRVTGTARYA